MFKGIQGILNKVTHKEATSVSLDDPKLFSIAPAEALFDNKKHQANLKKIPEYLSLSPENYETLGQPLLNRVAEFMQALPETRNSYYSHAGGLLDHALTRTTTALSICRAYFLPGESQDNTLSQAQTLWAYAIFSAGLLHDLGKVAVDLSVDIYNKQGQRIKKWQPFDGTMLSQGAHYKYHFESNYPEEFKRRATILLARQLLPAAGFRWLASNKNVLAVWLALLDDDQRGSGTLGPILMRADALAIMEYFNENIKTTGASQGQGLFNQGGQGFGKDTIAEIAAIGSEFIKWLQTSLSGGQLMLNQAPAFQVPGGMLLSTELFKLFVREHAEFKSWLAVQNAVVKLGLHETSQSQEVQFGQAPTEQGQELKSSAEADLQKFLKIDSNTEVQGLVLPISKLDLPANVQQQFSQNAAAVQKNTAFIPPLAQALPAQPMYITADGKFVAEPPQPAAQATFSSGPGMGSNK